ncbi:hypothetical protein B0H17DRAFT_1093782 [Mycena rosella]|uniref:F-box domain-containing protein n=1 Tax=Mycena rosella TaxID=1033263 RepID=A0AAD7G2X2_MYCRO|nr:hypothetical protein B0H17DRAFT_1093782 [Mycena rosella]
MDSMSRIPPELWLEMLSLLPRDILGDVSLTSRTFHRVIRPVLFARLELHTYTAPGEFDRYLERLDFWCSDDISPLVRSCSISPSSDHSAGPPALVFSKTRVAAFFERLPCFTALQRFSAEGVDFTLTAMAVLCRLPALDHLEIEGCRVAREVHSPRALHISRFSTPGIAPPSEVWIRLFHPDHLRELQLVLPDLGLVDTLPSFPHVHKLTTSWWGGMNRILEFLAKFPAIEVLTLQHYGLEVEGADTQAYDLFPLLREYTGRSDTLPVFLPLPSLTSLTVYSCSPRDLIVQLEGIRTPNQIISLTVSFYVFDPDREAFDHTTLSTLCGHFPELQELRISISHGPIEDEINSVATGFFETLAKTPLLPPSLKYLRLSWDFQSDIEDASSPPADKLPDFAALRDALVARCPALTALWLDGEDFLFQWRKSLDGTVEFTADNFESAEVRRHGRNALGF